VKALVGSGVAVDLQCESGSSALMLASSLGCTDAVSELVQAGADSSLVNDLGETALMQASSSGREEAVRALLVGSSGLHGNARCLGVNAQDKEGRTALIRAASLSAQGGVCVAILRLLIEAGADMEIAAASSHPSPSLSSPSPSSSVGGVENKELVLPVTALQLVTERNNLAALRVLLGARSASPAASHAPTLDRYVSLAEGRGHSEAAGLLRNVSDLTSSRMYDAAKRGDHGAVVELLEAGARPEYRYMTPVPAGSNGCDYDGHTALMSASRNGHSACVKILLTRRADVDATDTSGRTALMLACAAKHNHCVRLLVEKQAGGAGSGGGGGGAWLLRRLVIVVVLVL
jgi:ankyrin repeat protein